MNVGERTRESSPGIREPDFASGDVGHTDSRVSWAKS